MGKIVQYWGLNETNLGGVQFSMSAKGYAVDEVNSRSQLINPCSSNRTGFGSGEGGRIPNNATARPG
jgi:hypothetical protein